MNKFEYENLTPFKWFVLENFPFIEADFDALTEWQLFCKLGKEINKIINNENILGTQVEAVTNAFIELKNYVNNYFNNLDVQEEINNKLNEMAESGVLTELIKNYIDPINQAFQETINNQMRNQDNKINSAIIEQKNSLDYINTKVNAITNGSPLVANSISEMTDTSKTYVLTTDGYWYYYNGTEWTRGGIYQSTGISEDNPIIANINSQLLEIRTKVESKQLFDYKNFVNGYTLQSVLNVSTPNDLTENEQLFVTNTIILKEPLTENTDFSTNIRGVSRFLTYTLLNGNLVRTGNYGQSNLILDEENNNYKINIVANENSPIYAIRVSAVITSNTPYKNLYLCKTSDYTQNLDLEYKNYYVLNDKLYKSHLIPENPLEYRNQNNVNTFYKGIAIGDSLTEGTFNTDTNNFIVHKQYAYPMFFYKKTGVILRNFGVGGSTAESWYNRYANVQFPVYDFSIIALGVNDLLQNVAPEITIENINNIVNKLKTNNNDVKCFIATVNRAYKNSVTSSLYDNMNNAIRNYVEQTENCYLLDIAEYGLTEEDTEYVQGHLTAIGYQELAEEFISMINYNMIKYSEEFKNIQFSGTQYNSLPTD